MEGSVSQQLLFTEIGDTQNSRYKRTVQTHSPSIFDEIGVLAREKEKIPVWERMFKRFNDSRKESYKGACGFVNLELEDLNLHINDATRDTVLGRLFALYEKEKAPENQAIMRAKLCGIFDKSGLLRPESFIFTGLYLEKNNGLGNVETNSLL